MKSLCIYAYFEKNQEYRNNLRYFLQNGVNHVSDFVFVLNGKCSEAIPTAPNIRVINRENVGYDFGAYAAALHQLAQVVHTYEYFFFLNTSVRGPFMYDDSLAWQTVFIDLLGDNVKLVGTTINIIPTPFPYLVEQGFRAPYSHVQTQMFAMDKECLEFLKPIIFDDDAASMDFQEVIERKEIAMSQHVLNKGWNINCVLPKYKGLDYRTLETDINPTSASGDPSLNGAYFGGTYTPYDVVFVKTNRGLLHRNMLHDHDNEKNQSLPHGIIEGFCRSRMRHNYIIIPMFISVLALMAIVFCLKTRFRI